MAFGIGYGKIYELAFVGRDLKSGKPVVNIMHCRCGAIATPPAFGTVVANSSSATVLATARQSYIDNVLPLLSVNLAVQEYSLRSIDGWTTGGPQSPVVQATNATPIVITTGAAHGLASGNSVIIAGATGNTAANGTWVITRIDSTTFSLNGSGGNGAYTGNGTWAKVAGLPRLVHTNTDSLVPTTADLGGVAGEALPLAATMSARKLNQNVGRNWRGRLSFSPLAESSYLNGKATDAQHTANVNGLDGWFIDPNFANQAAPATNDQFMVYVHFSKSLAIIASTPFTSNTAYSVGLSGIVPRRNNGTLTRRKPRLTAPIA